MQFAFGCSTAVPFSNNINYFEHGLRADKLGVTGLKSL